jgi:hypothetical protein
LDPEFPYRRGKHAIEGPKVLRYVRVDLTTTGAGADDDAYGVPDGEVTPTDLQFYVNNWLLY